MTHKNGRGEIHPVAQMYAKEHLDGEMDRREFMARATALGVTASGAYGLCLLYTSPSPRDRG